jgi:RHS repeat-associated protein
MQRGPLPAQFGNLFRGHTDFKPTFEIMRIHSMVLRSLFLLHCFAASQLAFSANLPPFPGDEPPVELVNPPASEVASPVQFSAHPTTEEIRNTRAFEERLIPLWEEPTARENKALASAILAFASRTEPDDFGALEAFVASPVAYSWLPSVWFNLGWEYYNTGYFSRAIEMWENAWAYLKYEDDPDAKRLADRTVGELAKMHARIGASSALAETLSETEGRSLRGAATELIASAKQAFSLMTNEPEISFRCGPLALNSINNLLNPEDRLNPILLNAASSRSGFNIKELKGLSDRLHLPLRLARRSPGNQTFPVPAVVHWKVGHYAALIKNEGEYFLVADPTFGRKLWVSARALEEQSSGYFLIPTERFGAGWSDVDETEATTVWGRGVTTGSDPNATTPYDLKQSPDCVGDSFGMPTYSFHLLLASLNLEDTPLSFQPPVGQRVDFTLTYNQRDANQQANAGYSSVGEKWTCNWISYIQDNPNLSGDVLYYIPGGGAEIYSLNTRGGYDIQYRSQGRLVKVNSTTYNLFFPDGSEQVFARPDGSVGNTRKVFLTQIIDSTGYAYNVNYDVNNLLSSVTDPVASRTNLTFFYASDPVSGPTNRIMQVQDRYGRTATLSYLNLGSNLKSITDVGQLTSSLDYAGTFVTKLSTPYGDTTFTNYDDGDVRWLEATDPLGGKSRAEFNQSSTLGVPSSDPVSSVPRADYMYSRNYRLNARNTYYWDKKAMREVYPDHTKARIYHWLHDFFNSASAVGILESYKGPLESRIWFNYHGQPAGNEYATYSGLLSQPFKIGRVLDDGTTQLWQYLRNALGLVTTSVDPVGRKFDLTYADNSIDLLQVRQTLVGSELLATYQYNTQHLVTNITDTSGQTTKLLYNSVGQLTSFINANNETNTFVYTNGLLQTIDGPGSGDSIQFAYDSFDRPKMATFPGAFYIATDFDSFDRPLTNSFPDNSKEIFTYDKLDLISYKDRKGVVSQWTFNPLRQPIKFQQAGAWNIYFDYCDCGNLEAVIDPQGRRTSWTFDLQGRTTSKVHADGSKISFAYEAATSRLKTQTNERNQTRTHYWNLDDTLAAVYYDTVPDYSWVEYHYDPKYQRLLSTVNALGTNTFTYYPILGTPTFGSGQLASTDGYFPNASVFYTYDKLGRRLLESFVSLAKTYHVTNTYDNLGRLTNSLTDLGPFVYAYDPTTLQLSGINYPNNSSVGVSYYSASKDLRPFQISNNGSSGLLSRFTYDYNSIGQITSWIQDVTGSSLKTVTPGYDNAAQLTSALVSTNGGSSTLFSYAYDLAGNRTFETIGATTVRSWHNGVNQLVGKDTGWTALSRGYEWDPEGRLAAIGTGGRRTELYYNGFGELAYVIEKNSGTKIYEYWLIRGTDRILEERKVYPNQTYQYYFLYDHGYYDGASNSNVYWYRDHESSVREAANSQGLIMDHFGYDPYGRMNLPASKTSIPFFGFAGMLYHEDHAINLASYRAYDPDLGRWLSPDPIEESGGLNLYRYCSNDPVNYIDSLGLCPERGFVGKEGQNRDPNRKLITDYRGIPVKDQLNPFNPHNFVDEGTPLFGGGATGIAKGTAPGPVIIGETMTRVEATAAKYSGSKILNTMPNYKGMGMNRDEVTSAMMQYNRRWILEQMRSGRPIIDIGRDAKRTRPSIFYDMEQSMLQNYQRLHPEFGKPIHP